MSRRVWLLTGLLALAAPLVFAGRPEPRNPHRRASDRTCSSSTRACRRVRSRLLSTLSLPSRCRTSSDRSATRSSSSRARTARRAAAQLPGRLLHGRGGPRRVAGRRRHQRLGVRAKPVRQRLLHRAQQLLAFAVEPHDQRHKPELRLLQRRVLARVAGRPDAARARQRADDADGLLHGPVVCERRLHRRLGIRRQPVINGSQQQWMTRNSRLDGWTNGVWNQVFSGNEGAPAQCFPLTAACGPFTTLATSPVTREAPYLYVNATGDYNVFVPATQRNTRGTTWSNGPTAGSSIPLDRFFVAKPTDDVQAINNALAKGQNLIFTPGVYSVDRTIKVKRADTVVLGLGFATLVPQNGVVPMSVADVPGVDISGLIFDAGPVSSPVLLQVGTAARAQERPDDTTALQDVFFRIGGAAVGKATVEPRGEQRQRHPRRHLGVARRPRHRRGVDREHGRHRRRRQRRRRDRLRALRRALPEVRGDLEREPRHGRLLPERDAVRPAEPGGVDGGARRRRLGGVQDRQRR